MVCFGTGPDQPTELIQETVTSSASTGGSVVVTPGAADLTLEGFAPTVLVSSTASSLY